MKVSEYNMHIYIYIYTTELEYAYILNRKEKIK